MNDPVVTTQTEVLLYGLPDVVADVGGYLGLLLGASVLTIYELVESFSIRVAKRYAGPKGTAVQSLQGAVAK